MRVCFAGFDPEPAAALAAALGPGHEVTTVAAEEPDGLLGDLAFANPEHGRSAALLEGIEAACGGEPLDYVEFPDRRAPGLVALQARRAGHPLLRDAAIAIRMVGSEELTLLHDGALESAAARLLADLEREQLRLADLLVWPGGDGLDLYRRYYDVPLPSPARIGVPLPAGAFRPARRPRSGAGPLRILYLAPLERSRGALALAEACLRLTSDDWELTMVGADTDTTPGAQSVRLTIEEMFDADPRLHLEEPPVAGLHRGRLGEHDLLAAPGSFDVWPLEALEAMAAGLPLLATPVGGLVDLVEPGITGWVLEETGPAAIREALNRLIEDRDALEAVRSSGEPSRRARRLADPGQVAEAYGRTFEALEGPRGANRPRRDDDAPLVSAIVPYHRASEHIEEAVDSMLAQTHPRTEVIVVNDGSFEPEDEVLSELGSRARVRVVTQVGGGESAARNLGIALSRGKYVVMLDADNALEPAFVERALAMLVAEPELAYVTCWLRFVAPDGSQFTGPSGYPALGNRVVRDDDRNLDGDTLALLPRRIFAEEGYGFQEDCALHSDWDLYRRLRGGGRHGAVIPELLARYRVRRDSLLRSYDEAMIDAGQLELRGRATLAATRWTAEVGS